MNVFYLIEQKYYIFIKRFKVKIVLCLDEFRQTINTGNKIKTNRIHIIKFNNIIDKYGYNCYNTYMLQN